MTIVSRAGTAENHSQLSGGWAAYCEAAREFTRDDDQPVVSRVRTPRAPGDSIDADCFDE